jgi:hypothetical protein
VFGFLTCWMDRRDGGQDDRRVAPWMNDAIRSRIVHGEFIVKFDIYILELTGPVRTAAVGEELGCRINRCGFFASMPVRLHSPLVACLQASPPKAK